MARVLSFLIRYFSNYYTLLSLIHISEPTRRTPISYAVFCLKKKICRKRNKLIVSLESPHQPECICFSLNAIPSIIAELYCSCLDRTCVVILNTYRPFLDKTMSALAIILFLSVIITSFLERYGNGKV